MSGPVGAMQRRLDSDRVLANGPAEVRADPTWSEATAANWRLAQDDAEDFNYLNQLQGFGAVADELVRLGYPRARYSHRAGAAPRIPVVSDYLEWAAGPQKTEVSGSYQDRVWADLQAERRKNPKSFADIPAKTRAEFDSWAFSRRGARARDQATAAQGGTGTMILPSLAFGLSRAGDAENLPFLALGGSGRTFAGTLAKQFGAGVIGSAVIAPQTARSRINMGEGYSSDELLFDLGIGGVAQAGFVAAPALAGKAGKAAYDKFVPRDYRMARALKAAVPLEVRPPELSAALNVIERAGEIDMSSPYQWTDLNLDHHTQRIEATIADLAALPAPARVAAPPAARPVASGNSFDSERALRLVLDLEGGDRLVTDSGGLTKFGISANAHPGVDIANLSEAEALAIYRRDYLGKLPLAGRSAEAATVALDAAVNHGPGFARKILAAAGDDPAKMIALRRAEYARLIAEDPGKYGQYENGWENRLQRVEAEIGLRPGEAGTSAIGVADAPAPIVRPDAMDAVRPLVSAEGRALPIASFSPADIGIDAGLMQFKSGGDQFGVTERLRGVEQWDPLAAGMLTVWEGLDGRRLIADGHQRLGLAGRIMAADPAQNIRVNAFVLREADGFSAADARILTALKNIGEGTGTAIDAAKVFREVGLDSEAVLRRLPPKSALVRDGKALARLHDEAFGAVVNEVIPESWGAAIGHYAPDPASHMALVDLLHGLDPAIRKQAEAIVRQALDVGFHVEHQDELFGARALTSAIFAHKARLLERTLGELRKLKGAFGVAARNAEALDKAGNRIDVGASTAAAASNAQALALVDALALRKGNGVSDLFNAAAQRLAYGEPVARVTRDLVAQLSELDLGTIFNDGRALNDADRSGAAAFGSGRAGLAAGKAGPAPFLDATDGPDSLTPATMDELEAAGQGGFAMFDEPAHQAFDDPAGPGVKLAADSAWHDIKAEQEITLKAAETGTSEAKPRGEEIATPLELRVNADGSRTYIDRNPNGGAYQRFGNHDPAAELAEVSKVAAGWRAEAAAEDLRLRQTRPEMFDLDDGRGPRAIADILAELDAEDAGIAAIKGCLV